MARVLTALVDEVSPAEAIGGPFPAESPAGPNPMRRFAPCGGLLPGRGRSRRRPPEKLAGRSGCGSTRPRRSRRLPA